MSGRPLTGILLVGGSSSRFGSPKALARLRGETLADRAWRLLGEACDERIAVGKARDALELPFPLLEDGSEVRAPIAGVVAGLHAAAGETAVVLPVDCALVTPELLRTLGEERAVPSTGPLPGAYAKTDLPELERRITAGDYSLRGVNPRQLDVPRRLLLDVDTPRDLALAGLVAWARAHEDVRALVLLGSLARTDTPADEWSDIDVAAFVDDSAPYLEDDGWVAELGQPVLTFLEDAAVGGIVERRVLLEGGVDVDIVPVQVDRAEELMGAASPVLSRGFLVLHDELGIEALLERAPEVPPEPLPTGAELDQLCDDLWYHGLWTAKKLRRGELWTALECLDTYLRYRLLALLRLRARLDGRSPWHGVRFAEQWAGEPREVLAATFAGYDEAEVGRALWALLDLSARLEAEVRARLGLELRDRSEVVRIIERVQAR